MVLSKNSLKFIYKNLETLPAHVIISYCNVSFHNIVKSAIKIFQIKSVLPVLQYVLVIILKTLKLHSAD